jgi:hypothetical protein
MQICNEQPWLATCKNALLVFFPLASFNLDKDQPDLDLIKLVCNATLLTNSVFKSCNSRLLVLNVCSTHLRGTWSQNAFKFPLQGYKVFVVCDHGYARDWKFVSRKTGMQLPVYPGLSPTQPTALHLARTLPYENYSFNISMDNLFTTVKLLEALRYKGLIRGSRRRI